MKRIHLFLAAAAMLALAPLSQAAEGTAKLSWINPTTGCTTNPDGTLKGGVCDNVPLTGDAALTELQVFADIKAIVAGALPVPVKLGPGLTTTSVTKTVKNGDTLYFRMKACNGPVDARVCSDLSMQASKVIVVPDVKPGVPSSLSIAITVASLSPAEFDALMAGPDAEPAAMLF